MNLVNMNLVRMEASDFPLLAQWLDSERIYRWFGESEFWLSEFEYEPDSSFMVEYGEEKIGFCRYTTQMPPEYTSVIPHVFSQIPRQFLENQKQIKNIDANISLEKQKQTQGIDSNNQFKKQEQVQDVTEDSQLDFAHIASLPIYFVDYGIGSLNNAGQGLGKKMLQLLCDKIADKNKCVLAATSSLKNIASCRILESNGFWHDTESNLFLRIMS